MKKVISKGYTVEVVSWENYGDHYRTAAKVYDTKEEALAVKHLCDNVFTPVNRGGGIGNLMWIYCEKAYEVLVKYFYENPYLLSINNIPLVTKEMLNGNSIEDYMKENEETLYQWIDGTSEYNTDLLGYSEFFYSRVAENTTIYYSEKDIYLEEIID